MINKQSVITIGGHIKWGYKKVTAFLDVVFEITGYCIFGLLFLLFSSAALVSMIKYIFWR